MSPFRLILAAALALSLSACGSDPLQPASAALQAKDFAQAEALSAKALADKKSVNGARALRFVLFRHLSVQGDPEAQRANLNQAISEYDQLAKALGLAPNYADMEASLRSHPEGAALLAANRKLLYGE